MTTYRDTTLALLRALARGGTLPELAETTGLTERTVLRHLARLEREGILIARPPSRGTRERGVYRLGDRQLASALAPKEGRG